MTTVRDAAATLRVRLDDLALGRFERYLDLLLETNQQFNLTSVTEPGEAESRLLAESLAILPLIPPRARRLVDVGAGGGVPGIPLAIARPALEVHLLDATRKKVDFLGHAAAELGLDNVEAIHGRAEDAGRDPAFREQYDIVVARAVARLPALAELTLPFLKRGGIAILPKGEAVEDEMEDARQAIKTLGGELRPLVHSPVNRARLVVIDKRRSTPAEYPRRPGTPQRHPIGVPAR